MTATAEAIPVAVPDIGDFTDVPVIEILVAVGDTVAPEDPLVTLESDKATMDVPSPAAGVVQEVLVSVGDRVSEGTVIANLVPAGGASQEPVAAEEPAAAPPPQTPPPPPQPAAPPPQPAAATVGHEPVYASPSVRRLAREFGVELRGMDGSGRKGRITVDDVRAAANGGPRGENIPQEGTSSSHGTIAGLELAPWPKVDFEKYGPVERVPRSRIQRISAPNLARNWVMIPHVTQNDEADITELEAWRKQLNREQGAPGGAGVKVTMVSFLVAASVAALKQFPDFNASLDGDDLVLRRYYNIGFAADTPGGLVVPVIKGADTVGSPGTELEFAL